MVVKTPFVYIPHEAPLLDYAAWDRIRDMLENAGDDQAELVVLLRDYADQAALYLSRRLIRNPQTATNREWLNAVTSTVASIAAASKLEPRTVDEYRFRGQAIETGYLHLAALLLAWAAVTEQRHNQ
jgi:hypothetical protein